MDRRALKGCSDRIAIGLIHRQESARRCTRPKQRSMRFSQVPGKPIGPSSRGLSRIHALVNTAMWDRIEESCRFPALAMPLVHRTLSNPYPCIPEFHSVFNGTSKGFPHWREDEDSLVHARAWNRAGVERFTRSQTSPNRTHDTLSRQTILGGGLKGHDHSTTSFPGKHPPPYESSASPYRRLGHSLVRLPS